MKRIFLLFCIITCTVSMLMQCEKINNPKEIQWTTYTTSDGLASNNVRAIAIDKGGNKWFGTDKGVSKFDGTTWTTYTTSNGLACNLVNAIAIDKEGNKWFGTGEYSSSESCWGGVSKFDDKTMTNYTTSLCVNSIAIDKEDNMWFGGLGVSKFDGTSWAVPYNHGVTAMAIDREDIKWFGIMTSGAGPSPVYGNGVLKSDETTLTHFTTSDGLACNNVSAIAIDGKGNKWFGSKPFVVCCLEPYCGEGVSKFDGTTWTTYTILDGLIGNYVAAITIDKEENIWFGTDGGVSKFDGTVWTNYTTVDSLISNNVKAIAIDKEGNIWFGTDQGVSKLSY